MEKQVITKDDGRYLIFYTFPAAVTPEDEDDAAECSPLPRRHEAWTPRQAAGNGGADQDDPPLPLCLGEDPEA
jgi:hypothetical protein